VELFPEDNERGQVLTNEEFLRLYEQAADHLRPILLYAWETGMRRGEILSLTWSKVNLRESLIILESQDTKTNRRRRIPLSHKLRETLLALRQAQGNVTEIRQHVFVSKLGTPIKSIQEAFDNAVYPGWS
jgi:integrase